MFHLSLAQKIAKASQPVRGASGLLFKHHDLSSENAFVEVKELSFKPSILNTDGQVLYGPLETAKTSSHDFIKQLEAIPGNVFEKKNRKNRKRAKRNKTCNCSEGTLVLDDTTTNSSLPSISVTLKKSDKPCKTLINTGVESLKPINNGLNTCSTVVTSCALNASPEPIQSHGSRLSVGFPPKWFSVVEIEADVNNVFRCVSVWLQKDQNAYDSVKMKCFHFMKKNIEQFEDIISKPMEKFYENISHHDISWGTQVELKAVSLCYKINIYVYRIEHKKLELIYGDMSYSLSIYLLRGAKGGGEHYDLLVKTPENISKAKKSVVKSISKKHSTASSSALLLPEDHDSFIDVGKKRRPKSLALAASRKQEQDKKVNVVDLVKSTGLSKFGKGRISHSTTNSSFKQVVKHRDAKLVPISDHHKDEALQNKILTKTTPKRPVLFSLPEEPAWTGNTIEFLYQKSKDKLAKPVKEEITTTVCGCNANTPSSLSDDISNTPENTAFEDKDSCKPKDISIQGESQGLIKSNNRVSVVGSRKKRSRTDFSFEHKTPLMVVNEPPSCTTVEKAFVEEEAAVTTQHMHYPSLEQAKFNDVVKDEASKITGVVVTVSDHCQAGTGDVEHQQHQQQQQLPSEVRKTTSSNNNYSRCGGGSYRKYFSNKKYANNQDYFFNHGNTLNHAAGYWVPSAYPTFIYYRYPSLPPPLQYDTGIFYSYGYPNNYACPSRNYDDLAPSSCPLPSYYQDETVPSALPAEIVHPERYRVSESMGKRLEMYHPNCGSDTLADSSSRIKVESSAQPLCDQFSALNITTPPDQHGGANVYTSNKKIEEIGSVAT